ncbi:ABC transporter permease [Desulfurococcaceae archaeon MEX13E-LK6-19]|nr:ABC transporter permease [Desulfurococcaceae archaeon MEX13E-LK6-19]
MNWIIKRAILAFLTIYFAASLTFVVVRSMPGDPIDALTQQLVYQYHMTYEEARALAESIAPYVPKGNIFEEYIDYMSKFLRGDLGVSISYSTGTPVVELLADRIPWTVLVVATSLIISFGAGILIGMLMAYKHGGRLDSALALIFSITRSLPEYIVAIIMLSIFAFQLKWFPTRGAYSVEPGFTLEFVYDVLYHAALPIMTWVIVHIGGWALGMRGSTISVLGEDYITYARARGIPSRRIVFTYIGRNAILPIFTSFMISLGFMFGGSIFIEYIFSYPGVGLMLYQAITNRDWYLMLGTFDIIVIAVVTGTFLADILYGFLDPRIRRGVR